MELRTDGTRVDIREGRVTLRIGSSGSGTASLEVECTEPYELTAIALNAGPWSPDAYDVQDWPSANALVVSAAGRVVAYGLSAPWSVAAMGLEYEEAETIDRPWFTETDLLFVATDRRVWCLDMTPSIRWCWNVRTDAEDRVVCAPPTADQNTVVVTVRSRRGDSTVRLNANDGSVKQ